MEEYKIGFHNRLTFSQWMDREYKDDWPTGDVDNAIWYRYLEYVKEGDGEQ